MIRLQVRLTEYQRQRLKTTAIQQGVSVSELIRRAIDHELRFDKEELRTRALQIVGKYADTADDVSEQHDEYLAECFGK